VLPDNQALYPALGIHNPLPIDWMIPPDYQGSEQRIVDAAGSLGARGHYLVLFETFDAVQLSSIGLSGYERHAALAAAHPDAPLPYAPGVLQQVRDRLHGDAFGCGAFIGVYAP